MSLYLLCLAIGAIGLVSMALTGLGRHGHGHVGARLGGRGRAGHGHSPGRGAQPHHAAGVRATATAWLWNLTSPRVLFSVLIRFGTAGLLLRGVLADPLYVFVRGFGDRLAARGGV